MHEEYLDIVDEQDKVIDKKKRSDIYAEALSNFRVINAFITNSIGELWLPIRTAEKKIFPLCLDMSIAGHVESGESYETALYREAQEELNIDLSQFHIRFLGHLSPHVHHVSAFMNVYEIKMDAIPNYNKNDFINYILIKPEELIERLKNGEKAKTDLPKLVEMFYLKEEEVLTISDGTTLIKDRKFINLNWVKHNYQELIFENCVISNSNFSSSNLDGLRFINCRIFNCNFERASIQDGFFEDCEFYDKNTQLGCNFNLADLKRNEFHRCNLSMNTFKRTNAFQIVINECRAQGCDFQFANFSNIISRSALFSSAFLTKTDFRYANFEGVHLAKCDLSESKFVSVIFSKTNLEEANLTNTVFAPSQYDGLSLFKADLRNAEIANIDIRKIDFTGVKIFEWQQVFFMESLGVIIYPDKSN